MAYATVEDLETRMRTTFSESDAAYAKSLLEECSLYLEQVVAVDESDDSMMSNLYYATLSMVSRVMAALEASDISSMTTSAGSYSQTISYAQPYQTNNWWKLLRSSGYMARLGVSQGIGFARPSYGRLEVPDAES